MKYLIFSLFFLMSYSASASYHDIVCSTADQSVLFVGDDHQYHVVIKTSSDETRTYTRKEVRVKVPGKKKYVSKKKVMTECDEDFGIGLFNVVEQYVIFAKLTKKDGSGFSEFKNKKTHSAHMLCRRVQRVQGKCE